MKKYAAAKERNTGVWEFTFIYDPDAVTVIKGVPSFYRDWDGARKVWTIHEIENVNNVVRWLEDIGYEVRKFTLADAERDRRAREEGRARREQEERRFREEREARWNHSDSRSKGTSGNRARGPASDGAQDVFQALFNLVPQDRKDALYKALARVFHPDVGGDAEQMKALNKVAGR